MRREPAAELTLISRLLFTQEADWDTPTLCRQHLIMISDQHNNNSQFRSMLLYQHWFVFIILLGIKKTLRYRGEDYNEATQVKTHFNYNISFSA